MTLFDKREQGYEAKFAHDEEMRFKAIARRNRLLGNWAAARLGLAGDAAVSFANKIVLEELDSAAPHDVLAQLAAKLAGKGVTRQEVEDKAAEFLHVAIAQIEAGQ